MGVVTIEREMTTSVPPSTLFKFFVLENHNHIHKIIPHVSIEILEGNGGPGTIKKTTFSGEGSEYKFIKTKVEAVDKENFWLSYSIIDGEPWMDTLDKVALEFKLEASADGGSIVKTRSDYIPKENCEVDADKIKGFKAEGDKALGLYKAIEAYILANPDA